ncbi:MAG: RagB/SusD family nutrient uptake outer membrane protein [bacterium]
MMTHSMTRRLLASFAMACVGVSVACVDLTETPITGITSAYYSTPGGFDAAVSAMYQPLRSFWALERGATMTVFGTDEYDKGADGGYKFFNDYTSSLNGDVDFIQQTWRDFYEGINTANTVIDVAKTAAVPASTSALRVGEARFLRAMYYFTLVRTYGDVPLYLTPTAGVLTETVRDPAAKVYDAIIADLIAAEAVLPDKAAQYGRADKPAAQHLLGEVYMTRNAAGDMAKAETELQAVVSNPRFSLLATEKLNWDFGNEVNSEVVWAIQYVADPIANGAANSASNHNIGYGNKLHLYFGFPYDVEAGMTRDIPGDRPFKRFKPTTWLLGLWNGAPLPAGTTIQSTPDQRYQDIFRVAWTANNPNNNGYKLPDGTVINPKFAIGDTAVYFPSREVTLAERKAVKYRMIAPSEYNAASFPPINKYFDPSRTSTNQEDGQRDHPIMRLANTILMLAEAQFNQGKLASAVTNINKIRTRAAKPGRAAEMQITAADLSIDFILDERARELTGETTRFFDLTRTHKLVERVTKYNPGGAPNVKACHELRPIPTNEILLSTGGIKQNPCY